MNDQNQPPMNGNDDLAKTLNEGLQFEETPMNGAGAPATAPAPSSGPAPSTLPAPAADTDDDLPPMPSLDPSAGDPDNEPFTPPSLSSTPPAGEPKKNDDAPTVQHTHAKKSGKSSTDGDANLDNLKASALEELRPLVGKLKLPAEERFDTLLLIIRSTDDQSLLDQAHAAAKEITDDTRRAQALLDVIKEIDYFSSKR